MNSRIALVALSLLGSWSCADSDPTDLGRPHRPGGPSDPEGNVDDRTLREIAAYLCRELPSSHFTQRPLNDEMSRRQFALMFSHYDAGKIFFTDADHRDFAARQDRLDDEVCAGDASFAFDLHERYLERTRERAEQVERLVAGMLDVDSEFDVVVDARDLPFARDGLELAQRLESQLRFELAQALAVEKPDVEASKQEIVERYARIARDAGRDTPIDMVEAYFTALTESYDPHSSWMSMTTFEDFRTSLSLSLEGLGIGIDEHKRGAIVKQIVAGGAAAKHGKLEVDDVIVGVGEGATGPVESVAGLKINAIRDRIRGASGKTVRIEVIRGKTGERVVYAIVRAKLALQDKDAEAAGDDDSPIHEFESEEGDTFRIGIIQLPSFYRGSEIDPATGQEVVTKSATTDVSKILDDFNADGKVDAVILDLATNGGGSLEEARGIAGLFLPSGPITLIKDIDGSVTPHRDPSAGAKWKGPLVVRMNRMSASASEIVAAAIQDYDRGILAGDTHSFGKGTVQALYPLNGFDPTHGMVKLTRQKFYRVNGETTQGPGTIQDVVIPSLTDQDAIGEAKLVHWLGSDLKPGEKDTIPGARYARTNTVTGPMRAALRAGAGIRQAQGQFEDVLARRAESALRLNAKSMRVSRGKLEAERKKSVARAALEPKPEKGKKVRFGSDPGGHELLEITAHLVRLSRPPEAAKPPVEAPVEAPEPPSSPDDVPIQVDLAPEPMD